MEGLLMHKMIRIVCVLVIAGGVLFAQGTRTSDGSGQDALLTEVRALREEIRQIANASIRMQLLVARLQVQEQRVFTVARQLTDAQSTLAAVRLQIAGEQERVRQLEDVASRATSQGQLSLQQAVVEAGTQIEQQRNQELQLQARETELLKAVNEAQARWTYFNDQLDVLEKSLPGRASH
jgi:chromosome segregation ATPase